MYLKKTRLNWIYVFETQSQSRTLSQKIYSRLFNLNKRIMLIAAIFASLDCYFLGEEKECADKLEIRVGIANLERHTNITPQGNSVHGRERPKISQQIVFHKFPSKKVCKKFCFLFWQLQRLAKKNQLMLCYGCLLFTNLATW